MLEDISPFPINTYSRSVSSLWWRYDAKFLDKSRIEICFVDENETKRQKSITLTRENGVRKKHHNIVNNSCRQSLMINY